MTGVPAEKLEGLDTLLGKSPRINVTSPKSRVDLKEMSEVDMEILETFGREVCVDNKTNLPMYEPLAKLNDAERRMYDEINSRYETQFMR